MTYTLTVAGKDRKFTLQVEELPEEMQGPIFSTGKASDFVNGTMFDWLFMRGIVETLAKKGVSSWEFVWWLLAWIREHDPTFELPEIKAVEGIDLTQLPEGVTFYALLDDIHTTLSNLAVSETGDPDDLKAAADLFQDLGALLYHE